MTFVSTRVDWRRSWLQKRYEDKRPNSEWRQCGGTENHKNRSLDIQSQPSLDHVRIETMLLPLEAVSCENLPTR
jgi:hypothetical protein